MKIVVAQSTVADGSMLKRGEPSDTTVIENRRRFLDTHGITLDQTTRLAVSYEKTSFCEYFQVNESHKKENMSKKSKFLADALVVTGPNHALFLPVADCIGTVLFDPEHNVLMVSHLGRHSLEQHGGQKSVEYLQEHFNTNPAKLQVWLTAAPNKEVFPIWALDNKGMKEVTFEQLKKAGVRSGLIHDNPADTATDLNYFSYSDYLKGHRSDDGDHCIVAMMVKD